MKDTILTAGVFLVLIALFVYAANDWQVPWAEGRPAGVTWCEAHDVALADCEA